MHTKRKKKKEKREEGGLTDAYRKAINIYIYKYSEFSTDYISKGLKMCSELLINKNLTYHNLHVPIKWFWDNGTFVMLYLIAHCFSSI